MAGMKGLKKTRRIQIILVAFVALVFALTVVKVTRGDPMQGYDHVVQPGAQPVEDGA